MLRRIVDSEQRGRNLDGESVVNDRKWPWSRPTFFVWSTLSDHCPTFISFEGDASVDRGASPGAGRDGNLTAHQLHSLSHADEPDAAMVDSDLRVKANSQVANGQLNLSLRTAQFHSEMSHATVLHGILQSFL